MHKVDVPHILMREACPNMHQQWVLMPIDPKLLEKPTIKQIENAYRAAAQYQRTHGHTDGTMLDLIDAHASPDDGARIDASTWGRHRQNPPRRIHNKEFWRALLSFLEANDVSAEERPIRLLASDLCEFFGVREYSSSELQSLPGNYLYFQKSSWYPNLIQVGRFFIKEPTIKDNFLEIEEIQRTGRFVVDNFGYEETFEYFSGIAFVRQNMINFIMRHKTQHFPKFCMIYRTDITEEGGAMYSALYGRVLKATKSNHRRMHHSRIVLKRITEDPKIEGAISEDVLKKHYHAQWIYFFKNKEEE